MFSNNILDPGSEERTDMDIKLVLDLEYLSTFLARVIMMDFKFLHMMERLQTYL